MSEPWWKKIGEVAIEIAAATVVIVTTVFIERCLRTVGEESSGSSTLDPDGERERSRSGGLKSDDQ
jgi:hypothetical protein